MAVRIRLQRHGRKKSPFYHIVVAHSTSPRDGKFIERLGYYNPTKVPAQITLDIDKSLQWLQNGAEPSTTVNAILKYKGVLYKKHLLRGVKKGAFSLEDAETKFGEWQKSHEGAVMDHVQTVEDTKTKQKTEELERINTKRREKESAAQKAAAEQQQAEMATEETPVENSVEENVNSEAVSEENNNTETTTEESAPTETTTEESAPEKTDNA